MASDVVYVGCKMPNGVVLNLTKYELLDKNSGMVRRIGDELETVTLKGNAVKQGVPDLSVGGYVFTAVPRDFWEEWFLTHDDSSLLKDGYIMAPENTRKASEDKAKDHVAEPGQNDRLTDRDPRVRSLGVKKYDPEDLAA